MRAINVVLTLLGALWIGSLTVAAVYAQSSPLLLSVTPDVVALAPGETAQTIVTAKILRTLDVDEKVFRSSRGRLSPMTAT